MGKKVVSRGQHSAKNTIINEVAQLTKLVVKMPRYYYPSSRKIFKCKKYAKLRRRKSLYESESYRVLFKGFTWFKLAVNIHCDWNLPVKILLKQTISFLFLLKLRIHNWLVLLTSIVLSNILYLAKVVDLTRHIYYAREMLSISHPFT